MVGKSSKFFLAGQALQGRVFQGQAPVVRQYIGSTLKLQIIVAFVTSITFLLFLKQSVSFCV